MVKQKNQQIIKLLLKEMEMKLINFLLIFLTLTMLIGYTTASSFGRGEPFVADGLVSFWTFDKEDISGKTVKDIWGKNDGTMVGAPEIVDGKIDQALSFNGTSDMVEVPGNDDLTQIGTDSVTAEAWINVEKPCYGVINGRPFWILHWTGCGGLPMGMRFYIGAGGWKSVTSKSTVKEGWHHWVGVYDGKELKVYLDGKEDASVGSGGKLASTGDGNPDWLTFGKDYHTTVNNDRWNKVIIDEVRVYSRALTDTEVLQNFQAEKNELAVNPNGKLTTSWGTIKCALD
ncbi:TPA: LamG domain-containing protein [Candidatus Poribacteria bacterium]|nr:LamG domain-containing protein [Candidatus Poribacteria bacterium]